MGQIAALKVVEQKLTAVRDLIINNPSDTV